MNLSKEEATVIFPKSCKTQHEDPYQGLILGFAYEDHQGTKESQNVGNGKDCRSLLSLIEASHA